MPSGQKGTRYWSAQPPREIQVVVSGFDCLVPLWTRGTLEERMLVRLSGGDYGRDGQDGARAGDRHRPAWSRPAHLRPFRSERGIRFADLSRGSKQVPGT